MSNKPVIEIDVSDSQFRQFYELFQQYATKVEEMPDDWKKVAGATKDAGAQITDFAKFSDTSKESLMMAAIQADAIGKSVGEAIKAQKEFANVTRSGSSELEKMAKHAKSLGSEVFGIGKFLMKIGAIGFGVTGLGAILSGLGLRDLARSAISTQGEARSIGVTTGQLSAFQTDFGRYVDPSILGRAANAQSDMRKLPYAMLATGQSLSAIENSTPDELSLRMMQRAHDWWSKTPVSMRNAQTLQGTGLNQFMSFEEVRKLGAMTSPEFSEAQANYRKDAKSFNVSDKSTDAWYGFERELEAAGKLLKTDLTDRLSELTPNLKDFIRSLSGDAKILIDDVLSPKNLKSIGDALHEFAGYLASPKFQQDMRDLAGLIGDLAIAMRKAAKFLGIDTSPVTSADQQVPNANPGSKPNGNAGQQTSFKSPSDTENVLGVIRNTLNSPSKADALKYIANVEKKNSLPPGSLLQEWQKESAEGIRLVGPKLKNGDQAIGDFQFTSETWKDWGKGGDRFSFKDEADSAGAYTAALQKKYGGDIRKALAAYNWGPGNVDKDIAKNGANWESHLPAETRYYLGKISASVAQKSTVNLKVDVTNSTAARVAVSTNASAAGS